MNIQLVIADIDGTFLDSAGEPSQGALESIRRLRRHGIGFTLCSGRGDPGIRPFVELLELDQPYIVSGGAAIVNPRDHTVIIQHCLKPDQINAIALHGISTGCNLVFHTPFQLFVFCSDEFWKTVCETRWIGRGGWKNIFRVQTWQELCDKPIIRIDFFNRLDRLPYLAREVEELGQQVHAYQMPSNLEISDKSVSKGIALVQLANYLNIPVNHVLSIGDNVNDISMLETAGVGVAMQNSLPQVISRADLLAPSNDEGGLASVIDHLLDGTLHCLKRNLCT